MNDIATVVSGPYGRVGRRCSVGPIPRRGWKSTYRFGNMCLLVGTGNRGLGRVAYDEKKLTYRGTNIEITKTIQTKLSHMGSYGNREPTSPNGTTCKWRLAVPIDVGASGRLRAPGHLSFEEAATLPSAAVTAWLALAGIVGLPRATRC
jgi:hypothetical protein